MKGPQADEATVNEFADRLASLIAEAESRGVVLEVRLQPREPFRMGYFDMVLEARAAWRNS